MDAAAAVQPLDGTGWGQAAAWRRAGARRALSSSSVPPIADRAHMERKERIEQTAPTAGCGRRPRISSLS